MGCKLFTSMVLVNHHHLALVIKLIQDTLKQGSREGGDLLEVPILTLTLNLPCFSVQQCEHCDSFLKNFTMNCVFSLQTLFFCLKCLIQFFCSLQALFCSSELFSSILKCFNALFQKFHLSFYSHVSSDSGIGK